jgi:hypothetical protein
VGGTPEGDNHAAHKFPRSIAVTVVPLLEKNLFSGMYENRGNSEVGKPT